MQLEEKIKQAEAKPLKVLIVEDSPTFRVLHENYLQTAGYEAKLVGSGEEALQVLDVDEVDIILMDVLMPGLSGFETAKIIRETFPDKWIPILFITGSQKDEDYKEAIASGGDDYIVKPVREAALVTKLQAMANILNMQRGLYLAHEELAHKNKFDVLTSTLSRRYLLDEAETSWRLMRRMGHSLAVVMVDVDNFKKYNDHYGHAEGDECLKRVAEVLRNSFTRDTDLVGRLGGEEFLVVLPDTDTVEATRLAEECRKQLEELALPHLLTDAGIVTVSMGCAACHKTSRYELSELIRHSDELLYSAKSGGRNRVVWDDFPTSQQLLTGQHDISEPGPTAVPSKSTRGPKHWLAVAGVAVASIFVARLVVGDFGIGSNKYEDVETLLVEQGIEQPQNQQSNQTRQAAVEPEQVMVEQARVEQEPIIDQEEVVEQAAVESELSDTYENKSDSQTDIERVQVAAVSDSVNTVLQNETEQDNIAPPSDTADEFLVDVSVMTGAEWVQPEVIDYESVARARIFAWRDAWVGQRESYFDHYHAEFVATNGQSLTQWQKLRLVKIQKPAFIEVKIESFAIEASSSEQIKASFVQHYRSNTWTDKGLKTVFLKPEGSDWKIYREEFTLL